MNHLLTPCLACQRNVSSMATTCPNCGHPIHGIEAEQILRDVAANMWRGTEAVGGRIKITNQRVIFDPHSVNLPRVLAEIPFDNISDVVAQNTMGFVPNGISLRLKSGVEYRFVVWGKDELIRLIRSHLGR